MKKEKKADIQRYFTLMHMRLFFRVHGWRALVELVLVQSAIFLLCPGFLLLTVYRASAPSYFLSQSLLFYYACSLGWLILCWRLRPSGRSIWAQLLHECIMSGLFFIEIMSSLFIVTSVLHTLHPDFLSFSMDGSNLYGESLLAIGFVCTFIFIAARLSIHILRFWEHLRLQYLRWTVTHSHLMVVVISGSVISVLIVMFVLAMRAINLFNVPILSLVGIIFFMICIMVIVIICVLPPSILSSYIFTRRIIRRIEELEAATSALRAGDYSMRINVDGQDEIAHLQANFNAMATELERTMHELKEERDNVQTLLHARRELIASVSHELRTPVATVRSYLESALTNWQGDQPPVALKSDMQVIQQQTMRLQSLIDDLFTLARAEVGRLEMRCEPTCVDLLVQRVVDTIAPIAWRSGRIEVFAEIAALQPAFPLAFLDGNRLEQILHNLIRNSIRHTPPGGIIIVKADADKDSVILEVKDTGEGIAEGELPHIWERFYRTRSSSSQPGTGLGLAIVKDLTQAMAGQVFVTSIVGQGTCFTLHFPLDRSAEQDRYSVLDVPVPAQERRDKIVSQQL